MPDETDPAAIAARHGFGPDAAGEVLRALEAAGGGSAQFRHPELGGLGQWSRGGMTMVGDMFDRGLRDRVAALCAELDALPRRPREGEREGEGRGDWWPAGLGRAAASGAQDGVRYAFFPDARRLAVEREGRVTLHDTGPRRIGGVAQSQGGGRGSLVFRDADGEVRLRDLPEAPPPGPPDGDAPPRGGAPPARPPTPERDGPRPDRPGPAPAGDAPSGNGSRGGPADGTGTDAGTGAEWLILIERLAALHRLGVLTEAEFAAKKAELLARI